MRKLVLFITSVTLLFIVAHYSLDRINANKSSIYRKPILSKEVVYTLQVVEADTFIQHQIADPTYAVRVRGKFLYGKCK